MRSCLLAVSSIGLILVAAGCRQTTGSVTGSPLTPVSPLSPNASFMPAPASGIGPMGGSTRVPPPPTGSVGTPNSYVNPQTGQVNAGGFSNNGNAFAADSRPIGSGVQQVGWTETNANVPSSIPATLPYSGSSTSSGFSDGGARPKLEGMPVIDLTSAPPPPGYFPGIPTNVAGVPQGYVGQNGFAGAPANPLYAPGVNYSGASITSNGTFADPRAYAGNQSPAPSTPQPLQSIATAPTFQPAPATPATTPAPNTNSWQSLSSPPSTEPVPQNAGTSSDALMWRRPGTRY